MFGENSIWFSSFSFVSHVKRCWTKVNQSAYKKSHKFRKERRSEIGKDIITQPRLFVILMCKSHKTKLIIPEHRVWFDVVITQLKPHLMLKKLRKCLTHDKTDNKSFLHHQVEWWIDVMWNSRGDKLDNVNIKERKNKILIKFFSHSLFLFSFDVTHLWWRHCHAIIFAWMHIAIMVDGIRFEEENGAVNV